MGANPSKTGDFQDSISFKPDKIHQSASKKIKGLHIDEAMLPDAGVFVVGTESIENYSENGKKLVAFYKTHTNIVSSSISFSNCYNSTIIAVACQDNSVVFLTPDLKLIMRVDTPFKPEDIELAGYDIKNVDKKYFELATVESVLTPFNDSFLVGYNNGFVKEYSWKTPYAQTKVYNPVLVERPKEGAEAKEVIIEEVPIPGTLFLAYGNISEIIFVNHKRTVMGLTGEVSGVVETPVIYYKHNGDTAKKFKVTGDILSGRILENRNHYLCLTSNHSELYIYNFYKDFMIMKVSLDIMKNPQLPLYFTGMTVHEFEMNQRNQLVSSVLQTEESKETIDGDIIIGVENSGSILISKLVYESQNGKISFAPLKYINARGESKVPKNNTIFVSRTVYVRGHDRLMFSDQQSEIVSIHNLLKMAFKENKTSG